MTAETVHYDNLPARLPDLVLQIREGSWYIRKISPQLIRLADLSREDIFTAPVDRLFPRAVPALPDLAEDALREKKPLSHVHIRLIPGRPGLQLTAMVQAVPRLESDADSVVRFYFQDASFQTAAAPRVFQGMVGVSPAMLDVFRKITLYGPSDASVVVTGETGTGKELVAEALHNISRRFSRPYVAVNCSAISKELLESELFGHERGAFTGALQSHKGRFERASGGSIFLDEVGDMPLATQVKLLRVLENRTIERVGSDKETPIDVRVISATNAFLEREVAAGRFRSDLYHRLAILRIHVPPLRERIEDLPFLVDHFLEDLNARYGKAIRRLTPEALSLLQAYLWPGNIRELRNVLERMVVETEGEVIGARAFREWIRERQQLSSESWEEASHHGTSGKPIIPPFPLATEHPLLTAPENHVLEMKADPSEHYFSTSPASSPLDENTLRQAYRAADGNISAVARKLGVHRATIYRHLRRLGLAREDLDA